MNEQPAADPKQTFGTWVDADRLRRWAFLHRTPPRRLDWLVQALEPAYQSGAIKAPSDFKP
jgi:hypothetical protein